MIFPIQVCGSEAASLFGELHQAAFIPRPEGNWDSAAFRTLLEMNGAVGLIGLKAGSSEPGGFILFRTASDEAEVITLGTLPPWRRSGLATALVEEMISIAREKGVLAIYLEVGRSNGAARAFYRKLGFSESGVRRNYFRLADGTREDALLLRRDI